MKTLITLSLLFLTSSYALAEETETVKILKEYDVEIIIFEDAHARYINSETWGKEIDISASSEDTPEATKKLDTLSKKTPATYSSIKPEILQNEYKKINKSSEYEVLFYGSWRQPGLDEKIAFEIDINDLINTHETTSKNKLNGSFRLVLARYLHFYTTLDYQREIAVVELSEDSKTLPAELPTETANISDQNETTTTELQAVDNSFVIDMHRRMRSKELHYIDHPLIGVLIQINPVKKPEEEIK